MPVFCGQCSLEFESEELELAHLCSVTGVTPTEPESMGTNWDTVQLSALDRGKDETTKKKLDDAKKAVTDRALLEKSLLKPKLSEEKKLEYSAIEGEIIE